MDKVLLIVITLSLCFLTTPKLVLGDNDSPIIGILGDTIQRRCDVLLSEEQNQNLIQKSRMNTVNNKNQREVNSCFTAYYVHWIEQGGGRVVPIRYDTPYDELKELMSKINGVLFTGGGLELALNSTYVQTAMNIFKLSQTFDYFPVWGTCQGIQVLSILAADNASVLQDGFDSEDLSLSLDLTQNSLKSRLFSGLPGDIIKILALQNVTMNYHYKGVTPQTYYTNSKLNQFYQLLSTNQDRKGREFISTIESKQYPIYGCQWHPERQVFSFNPQSPGLNHSYDSIRANSAVGQFFVNECRKNNHHFFNKTEEDSMVIYNYVPVYYPPTVQVYLF